MRWVISYLGLLLLLSWIATWVALSQWHASQTGNQFQSYKEKIKKEKRKLWVTQVWHH